MDPCVYVDLLNIARGHSAVPGFCNHAPTGTVGFDGNRRSRIVGVADDDRICPVAAVDEVVTVAYGNMIVPVTGLDEVRAVADDDGVVTATRIHHVVAVTERDGVGTSTEVGDVVVTIAEGDGVAPLPLIWLPRRTVLSPSPAVMVLAGADRDEIIAAAAVDEVVAVADRECCRRHRRPG